VYYASDVAGGRKALSAAARGRRGDCLPADLGLSDAEEASDRALLIQAGLVGQEHGRECRHPAGVEGAGHHLHRGVEPKTKIKKTTKKNKKQKELFFCSFQQRGICKKPRIRQTCQKN